MAALLPTQALVAENVILDSRLALIHTRERWLAIADLHFGYELSQRAAGSLVPLWGMDSIEQRLVALLDDFQPDRLLIVGDLVHDRAAGKEATALLARLSTRCEVIAIAGNHDRRLGGEIPFVDSWQTDRFHFHHGHCEAETSGKIQIIGHHHPAAALRDGAGLHLKLPALVQGKSCWILPAFSPWSAGTTWKGDPDSRLWICSPTRVFPLPLREAAVA